MNLMTHVAKSLKNDKKHVYRLIPPNRAHFSLPGRYFQKGLLENHPV